MHGALAGALHCIPLEASSVFFGSSLFLPGLASGSNISTIDIGLIAHAYSTANAFDEATLDWLAEAIRVTENGTSLAHVGNMV